MQVQHGATATTTTTGTPRHSNDHLSFDLEGYHQQLYNQREQLRQFYRKQQEHLRYEKESEKQRRAFLLNNKACELVLSEDYSEANHLFETALMLQKEESSAAMQKAVVLSPRRRQHHRRQHSFESCTAATTTTTTPDYRCCFKDEHDDSCDCNEDQDLADDDGMDWDRKDDDAEDYYFEDGDDENYDHCIRSAGPSSPSWSSSSTPTTTVPYHDSNNYEATHHHLRSPPRSPAAAATPPPPAQATKDVLTASHASPAASLPPPRMTTTSRLRGFSYCGKQRYHETGGRNGDHQQQQQQQRNHQVYCRPIVVDEFVWETAPSKDKSFVLIFNTALCNHLWGMRLMEECALLSATIRATAAAVASAAPRGQPGHHNYEQAVSAAASAAALSDLAGQCYETLSVAKILYRLALENSVSFSHGVDKLAYVALYNNLSHLCKSLEGCETAGDSSFSEEALWCDEMLLKAVFWWRDSTTTTTSNNNSNHHQALARHGGRLGSSSSSNFTGTEARHGHNNSDEDDEEIVDAFLDNVFYRIGVTEEIAPAAAA